MATIDLSGYRMIARYRGRTRPYIYVRPTTQGQPKVGDTIILREGEAYRVTAVGAPETLGKLKGDICVDLEPIND